MGDHEQSRLDVGDTRKPIVVKEQRRVTSGDLAALAMCAHRYDPDDLAGWYTHEFGDVLRQWITSNVGNVIARLSPHCEDTRGDLPPLHPADDLWVGEVDTGPEQATLVTDGGQSTDGTERTLYCHRCDADTVHTSDGNGFLSCEGCGNLRVVDTATDREGSQ
ncbi:hypothetical protein [Haloarcula pellucida]|uniref:Uncharacterized protein n=1 Tax=Haloarcula pellucida TaxID=1427151 RepID=A0A830GJP9_9EURY|nr:hypothetical protein [Halomicroarcula pellucida]MBX0348693.1 hypothetical protein [Halomicroarcula pellucida]GGN92185.1 hypothetical protein GCM10009030_16160 [Halomicroarcula pellucida]